MQYRLHRIHMHCMLCVNCVVYSLHITYKYIVEVMEKTIGSSEYRVDRPFIGKEIVWSVL